MVAGDPTATTPSGSGFKTRLPAPTVTLLPIEIFPSIVHWHPRNTLSPSFGCLSNRFERPVPY